MEPWADLEGPKKRGVMVCHRRWGKDDIALHYTATELMTRPAMYWHMLPKSSQADKAIWSAVNPHTGKKRIDEAFPKEIRSKTREDKMMITFINGSVWQVVGSDNYDSLVGTPPVGLVFSEWPLADPGAWTFLSPIIEENGGWALFIYTPRGDNHGKKFYDMAVTNDRWFAHLQTAEGTDVFTPEQLEGIKRELIELHGETRGLAKFNQEYMCSFHEAFDGKPVYPDFSRRHHVSTEPLLKYAKIGASSGRTIIRGWDNTGLSPACIICYINTVGVLYCIREFVGDDDDIVEFGEAVMLWCEKEFPGSDFKDTEFRDIGDPGGNIRDSRKKSPSMYLREELGLVIEDGIQTFKIRRAAVTGRLSRMYRGEPAIQIDPSCKTLIAGFEGGYHFPEIGNTGYYHPEPKKNIFSHIHDALQYLCTIMFTVYNSTENSYNEYEDNYTEGRNKYGGY